MAIPTNVMALPAAAQNRQHKNRRMALQLGLVALFFVGFGFAMVPMYNVFCRVTGLNGRTNASAEALPANTQVDASRSIRVEFLSQNMPGVGVALKPERYFTHVHPGAVTQISYVVKNLSNKVFVGQAVPSVTPAAATQYFQKIQCFCFSQQTLQPGEERTMPVVFVVRPELPDELRTITLSYTFFEAPAS